MIGIIQTIAQRVKEFENKTEMWEDIRRSSGHLNEITEGKDGSEAIFEEMMTLNFLQVMKHKFLIFLKAEQIKKKSYLDTF